MPITLRGKKVMVCSFSKLCGFSVTQQRVFFYTFNRFIKFCKDSKGYRGCDFKPAIEDDEDLINRLRRVHLDTKEALEAVESTADDTVTQAEQPEWCKPEEF